MSVTAALEVALIGLDEAPPGLDASALDRWLVEVVRVLCPEAVSMGVRFVGDQEMRDIHRRYRGRDHSTDVLSFPGDDTPEGRHLGDLVVSLERASSQAAESGLTLDQEVRELLLHGVLHCLGQDHETDQGEMDRLELELRRRFVAAPFPAGQRA
ncbi:MAG TPA: rRNA maturation RNase YbeY [Thermoanaerobaculia bacterium]|nr:rRNA maturation RNase YbeY [Thermoanaerobaculia bacterium]